MIDKIINNNTDKTDKVNDLDKIEILNKIPIEIDFITGQDFGNFVIIDNNKRHE